MFWLHRRGSLLLPIGDEEFMLGGVDIRNISICMSHQVKLGHPSAPGPDTDPHDRRTSRRALQRGRKTPAAADQKTNQGRGKDVPPPRRLLTYETGRFICYQKRTFSPASDTCSFDGLPAFKSALSIRSLD